VCGGSLESSCRLFAGSFGSNLVSVAVKMISRSVSLKRKLFFLYFQCDLQR
jgi:hypothetical protein